MRILSLFLMTMAAVAIASPVGPANLLEKRCDLNCYGQALEEAEIDFANDPDEQNAVSDL